MSEHKVIKRTTTYCFELPDGRTFSGPYKCEQIVNQSTPQGWYYVLEHEKEDESFTAIFKGYDSADEALASMERRFNQIREDFRRPIIE